MKAETVCAGAQADFLRSSGPHSVQEIAKSLKKTERRVNKWSKTLKKTNQGVHSRFFFFTNSVRNWIEKASDKSNNSTREIAKKI